jgi:5-methyltetrahydrofolate--homocysteine methyltransferase
MKNRILDGLLSGDKPVLYDGATGTLLQEMGLAIGTVPEQWVLDNPAHVYMAAQAYVNAGAQIILTCTFGGTTFRLLDSGLEAQGYVINRRAAELAREAAGGRVLVAGSIGPLGRLAIASRQVVFEDAVDQFAAQAQALVDGGVDLLQIESMSDLDEVRAAVQGVRRVTDLPVFVTLSFDTDGRTLLGITPLLAARELAPLGLGALGANCGSGPEDMPTLLRMLHSVVPDMRLIAKPNAGIPTVFGGKAVYSISAEQFARYAVEWVAAGANIVGGCCGTTPAYIAEIRRQLQSLA